MSATMRAIVTGGSTGIGVAICRTLLADGYEVVALSRRPAGISARGLRSIAIDLADSAATCALARELAATDPATTLVHNAGAVREQPIEAATVEDLDALTALHLAAPLALLQANLAAMKAARRGRVVLIASRAMLGLANRSAYAATKAGMLGLARTWALELGPHGITVNVVAPGPIEDTEMFDRVLGDDAPRRQRLAQSIPVRRLGKPADVARAVSFFVAPAADFVTGQTLYVCGGTSVGTLTL